MSSGIIQLASVGLQNFFLSDNPEITFFKCLYQRYTNFAICPITQRFNNDPNFGDRVTCTIANTMGLITKATLVFKLPQLPQIFNDDETPNINFKWAWINRIGYALIKSIEIEIGNKLIDRQYGEWINIWHQIKTTNTFDQMIGNIPLLYDYSSTKPEYSVYVPLPFWFSQCPGNAVPIICLKQDSFKINLEITELEKVLKHSPTHSIQMANVFTGYTKDEYLTQAATSAIGQFCYYDIETQTLYYTKISNNLFQTIPNNNQTNTDDYLIIGSTSQYQSLPITDEEGYNNGSIEYVYNNPDIDIRLNDCYLIIDYVILDESEKARLLANDHRYVINQLLYSGEVTTNNSSILIDLPFYNPVSLIVWTAQLNGELLKYTNENDQTLIQSCQLLLNSNPRTLELSEYYYHNIQALNYLKNSPQKGIYFYSFALNPLSYQPSGTCNMSVIDKIQLMINFKQFSNNSESSITVKCYAISLNILSISAGIGGVLFVN